MPISLRSLTAVLAAAALTAGLIPQAAHGADGVVDRIDGTDRIDTSNAVFQQRAAAFGSGTAVIARADQYADALTATPLAAAVGGPMLLTMPTSLDPRTLESLHRQGIRRVYLAGGEAAIARAVASTLTDHGIEVRRIAGDSRYETAVLIALEVLSVRGTAQTPVFVATGSNYPDALAAGAAAASQKGVVLLSGGATLDDDTAEYLETGLAGRIYAVGGPAARAVDETGLGFTPIVGASRYDTATGVAARLFPAPRNAVLTSGTTFADALSGGALAAATGAPLLLTPPASLDRGTAEYLAHRRPGVDLLGGTAAISATVETQTVAARNGNRINEPWTAPRIATSLQDVYATVAGRPVSFTQYAVGSNLSYQWYQVDENGRRTVVPGQQSPTFSLPSATMSDTGMYVLGVSNTYGVAYGTPTVLVVPQRWPVAVLSGAATARVGQLYVAAATNEMPRSYPAIVPQGATDLESVVKGDYVSGKVSFEPLAEDAGRTFEVVMVTEDGQIETGSPRLAFTVSP